LLTDSLGGYMARFRSVFGVFVVVVLFATIGVAQDVTASLTPGKAELQSAGVMTFGANGVLFVADSLGATIYALDTQDRTPSTASAMNVTGLRDKIAGLLGTTPDQVLVNDVAVNPISRNAYVSVARGLGPTAAAVIVKVTPAGQLSTLSLDNVRHSKVALPNPGNVGTGRGNARAQSVTDMGIADGRLFVAGLSNEEFASTLRSVPLPFPSSIDKGTSIEIWHGNHNRFETNAPVRVFVPYKIGQQQNILAAYTCTPLVKFDVAALKPGTKVVGTTIAELGMGNNPLDMIVYNKDGKEFFLMSNDRRGVMKLPTSELGAIPAITTSVPQSSVSPSGVAGTAGLGYETIAALTNVQQLDKYNDQLALILQLNGGSLDLKTVALP
jgi:hypothetical protein